MIVNLTSKTHPQAEIVSINLRAGTVDFRWIGEGLYSGDCSIPVEISSMENAEAEITVALEDVIDAEQ